MIAMTGTEVGEPARVSGAARRARTAMAVRRMPLSADGRAVCPGVPAALRAGGRMSRMALTALVKDELSRLAVTKPCCRKAEVSATLRFAGGLHIVGGRIVVEAELDTGAAARRLRTDISEVFGHDSDLVVVNASGLRRSTRFVLRVIKDGEALARQTGLI